MSSTDHMTSFQASKKIEIVCKAHHGSQLHITRHYSTKHDTSAETQVCFREVSRLCLTKLRLIKILFLFAHSSRLTTTWKSTPFSRTWTYHKMYALFICALCSCMPMLTCGLAKRQLEWWTELLGNQILTCMGVKAAARSDLQLRPRS